MVRLILLFFAIGSTICTSVPRVQNELFEWEGRIIRGEEAQPGQFPHQASLRALTTGTHICGAAIISSRWLVSAAQCTFRRQTGNIEVLVGTTSISGVNVYRLARMVHHPSYNPNSVIIENDISLLETQLTMSGLNIASRPLASEFTEAGLNVFTSGWGQINVSFYKLLLLKI